MSRTECVSGKKNLQLPNSYPIALDGFRKALEKIQISRLIREKGGSCMLETCSRLIHTRLIHQNKEGMLPNKEGMLPSDSVIKMKIPD